MTSFLKKHPAIWIQLLILTFVSYVFIDGIDQGLRHKLFPYFVSIVIVLLSVIEWTVRLWPRKAISSSDPSSMDSTAAAAGSENGMSESAASQSGEAAEPAEQPDYNRRVGVLLIWIAVLFIGVILIGVLYMIPLFLASFLYFESKLSWWKSLLITAIVWIIIKYLFINFLHLSIPDALLF